MSATHFPISNLLLRLGPDLHVDGPAVAFASLREPSGECRGEAFGRNAEAGFDLAFGNGKRVVELGGVREVTHAEAVEPLERARLLLSGDDHVNLKPLRVHGGSIASGMGQGLRATKVLMP